MVLRDDGLYTRAARMAQSVYGMEVLEAHDVVVVVWMEDPELYVQHLKARPWSGRFLLLTSEF